MKGQIEIDRSSFDALNKNFDDIKKKIPLASYHALVAFLFNAKSLAQNRLKANKHIVTSRLRNSIYVKSHAKRQDNKQYSDRKGRTYSADLETVALKDQEAAIGTNVEYAAAIERGAPAHIIRAKNGKALSWLPEAAGEAWFTGKTKSTLRKYYKDRSGGNTLRRMRIFAKQVLHPGYPGDSFLWWGVQNADDKEFVKEYNRQVKNIKLRR